MRPTYQTTVFSCFTGYIVQAIINNFVPLLFVTFQTSYQIPLSKITLLITINFTMQLLVDLIAARYVDKIGYRVSIVAAHIFSAAGLIFLSFLPDRMEPFTGILIAVLTYSIGGGLIEVLVSPIIEGCPTGNKEKAMSLLHSFYCWGHVAIVLLSTLFFQIAGINHWQLLALIWAAVPVANGILFLKTPIAPLLSPDEKSMDLKALFKNKIFWILMLMMLCAGASEQSVVQWVSTFAEQGLGISKATGDLAGPMTFAILMGSARAFYGKFGDQINLEKFMLLSTALCIFSYLLATVIPSPAVNLIGCGLCGFSVGIMWPGTFSKAAAVLRSGGTALFAMLALAGDLGCSSGPTLVGMVSNLADGNLKAGILTAILFPITLFLCLVLLHNVLRRRAKQ